MHCSISRCFALLLLAAAAGTTHAQTDSLTSALPVARALIDAFNQHDPVAMGQRVSPTFELYYVDEAGTAVLSASGRADLVAQMTAYFDQHPEVSSSIVGAVDGPSFVSFREQITGGAASLAVYEIREGVVRRAWYFPAE